MVAKSREILQFHGENGFRQRLLLATLSNKSVKISGIRSNAAETETGLRDFEASFLRLLQKMTNGSTIEISHTGTSVTYHPGIISGGSIRHECPPSRSIGYFLEAMLVLAPFGKAPLNLVLTGITNDNVDVSVDAIRTVILPQLARFGVDEGVELKINKRGAAPLGGGHVTFTCAIVRALKPLVFIDQGLIKRIRGIAYATRMSPQMANRMVESSRSILTRYIPDVYLYTDVYKGAESGQCPGYALSLVAESTTGALISSECAYQPRKRSPETSDESEQGVAQMLINDYTFPTPEDLGVRAARQLLVEIKKGGSVDGVSQWINILFMTLSPEDVCKIRIGSLTPFTIQYLRDVKAFLGVTFKMTPEKESHTIIMTTVGTGFINVNKKVA